MEEWRFTAAEMTHVPLIEGPPMLPTISNVTRAAALTAARDDACNIARADALKRGRNGGSTTSEA
jgi:hypothetical protein